MRFGHGRRWIAYVADAVDVAVGTDNDNLGNPAPCGVCDCRRADLVGEGKRPSHTASLSLCRKTNGEEGLTGREDRLVTAVAIDIPGRGGRRRTGVSNRHRPLEPSGGGITTVQFLA